MGKFIEANIKYSIKPICLVLMRGVVEQLESEKMVVN